MSQRTLPSGRVTFAFTDVVGSTKTFFKHGDEYVEAVQALQQTVAEHAAYEGGVVVSTEGDGAMLAFPSAAGAVRALVTLQQHLEERPDEGGLRLRLRAGAHVGDAEPIGDFYVALPVYVAARVSATAGAGQVVVSAELIEELGHPVGEPIGDYRLKDIAQPVTLWRVAGDDAPLKATPARRTNVAEPHTTFLGRSAELARLRELTAQHRLVTVAGTGGLGKTRIVSEFALAHSDEFAAGIWLVELAPLKEGPAIVPQIASVLGLAGQDSLDAVVTELDRLGDVVLILDNCEHLTDQVAELVEELLARCANLRLLCTTREPLDLPPETVFRLPAMASGGPGTAEELFRERAKSAGAYLGPDDDDAVTELCALLDGVPLALELAAARAAVEPVASLVDGLRHGDLPLQRRGGDARQRSLEALVQWSLQLLDEPQRDATYALAVLPGRFTAEMGTTVLAALPGARGGRALLAELVRKSLLDLDGSEYRMLATVSTVARHELGERPELWDAAMRGVFTWASKPIQGHEREEAPTPDQVRALELALEWGLDRSEPGRGIIATRLQFWRQGHALSPETTHLLQRILKEPLGTTADDVRLNVAAMKTVGGMLVTVDDTDPRRALDVVEVARAGGMEKELSLALAQAAMDLDRAGRHAEAEPLHLEDIELCRQLGFHHDQAIGLLDLGVSYHVAGRLEDAEQAYRRALESPEIDPVNAATCRINIGEALLDGSRYAEAAAQLRDGLRDTNLRPFGLAWGLALLAEAEAGAGNLEEAQAVARQAEREFAPLADTDPTVVGARERMRQALVSGGQ